MAPFHSHPLTHNHGTSTPRREDPNRRDWQQFRAFLLLGVAGLLLLALLSYHPGHLPSWLPRAQHTPESTASSNLVGPIGALVAGSLFFLVGVAAFWVPVALVWAAVATYFQFPIFRWRTLFALGVFLVSGACLVQFQPLFFEHWPERFQLPSKGGMAGYAVGEIVVKNTIGHVGGSIVTAVIHLIGLIFVVGVHPFELKAYVKRKLEERELPPPTDDEPSVSPGPYPKFCNIPEHRCLDSGWNYDSGGHRTAKTEDQSVSRSTRSPERVYPSQVFDSAFEDEDGQEFEDYIDVTSEPDAEAPCEEEEAPVSVRRAGADPNPNLSEIVKSRESTRPSSSPAPRAESAPASTPLGPVEVDYETYECPDIDLLEQEDDHSMPLIDDPELEKTHQLIVNTLQTFSVDVSPGEVTCGPTITRYEIYPSKGLRVKQITSLEADLARATRAKTINILAPIPGKDTVGIEIENSRKTLVPLRSLLDNPEFHDAGKKIPIALGKDVYGQTIVADLAAMPHLLVAGATGSGKSVCINCIVASLLFRFKPDELRLIMIDPKVVEMQVYHSLPHLAVPVVTDPRRVPTALQWVIDEMERRYQLFAKFGVRKLEEYNKRDPEMRPRPFHYSGDQMQVDYDEDGVLLSDPDREDADSLSRPAGQTQAGNGEEDDSIPKSLPYIVVIIDELADLMQTAAADVEASINRLCQKARAAGIHLIVATQSPRVDVVTGLIKANIPARIAFQVASNADSRVILDKSGAEKLVGKGDLLYQPPDSPIMVRAQGAFLADEDVNDIVEHCSSQAQPRFDSAIEAALSGNTGGEEEDATLSQADEETLDRCIEAIRSDRKASASYLQRRLRIGYVRAARMMDLLEERGIVGPADGSKPREIYLPPESV